MKNQSKVLVTEDVAIPELKTFLEPHLIGIELTDEDIKESYGATLIAVKKGLLTFDKGEAHFKLLEPIQNEEKDDVLTEVTFKTRIRPNELANLSKGLNLNKDSFQYALKCTAFIISQPVGYLNKLGKFDYTVIQQLAAVFM